MAMSDTSDKLVHKALYQYQYMGRFKGNNLDDFGVNVLVEGVQELLQVVVDVFEDQDEFLVSVDNIVNSR